MGSWVDSSKLRSIGLIVLGIRRWLENAALTMRAGQKRPLLIEESLVEATNAAARRILETGMRFRQNVPHDLLSCADHYHAASEGLRSKPRGAKLAPALLAATHCAPTAKRGSPPHRRAKAARPGVCRDHESRPSSGARANTPNSGAARPRMCHRTVKFGRQISGCPEPIALLSERRSVNVLVPMVLHGITLRLDIRAVREAGVVGIPALLGNLTTAFAPGSRPQWMTSIRPSRCSTIPVQLSTQSPQLR